MIAYSGWTNVGLVRKNNEDYYQIAPVADGGYLFLVADGIGGSAGGEVASQTAVETIVGQLASTTISNQEDCRNALSRAILSAHRAVRQRADTEIELTGMGTTLTMLALWGRQGLIAHAGDSRAYLYRNGNLQQITMDHTLGQEWVRDGKITEEEALFHPYRHMLTRALGIEPFLEADLIPLELVVNDRILICSDGLSNMVKNERIAEMIGASRDMNDLCTQLGEEALRRGGHDNITLIAVSVENNSELKK